MPTNEVGALTAEELSEHPLTPSHSGLAGTIGLG